VFTARIIVGFVVDRLGKDAAPPVKRDAVDVPPRV
jgi:hypothetical protein